MPDAHAQRLLAELTPVTVTGRWTPMRKSIVCELIRRGVLTIAQACARYDLSIEEITSWTERDAIYGRKGLAVTNTDNRRKA